MYLTVDSFIEINNIRAGSNNVTLRKVNVKPCGFEKMYMNRELIEDKLYQIIDEFRQIQANSIYETMSSCCLKCRKNTKNKNPKVAKNGRIMLLSKCAVCDSIKAKFIKQQEASGLLSSLGLKAPLNKIPYYVFFCFRGISKSIQVIK